ncbi:MAG: hypothetical protein M1817_006143 [Caeruleum heppii]|nr:MAG: hypothetical protein M1817_006143 [Caeruleum heppii]
MTELTGQVNDLLEQRDSALILTPPKPIVPVDEFLKEAYRIQAHVASFHGYLRSIRQPYLSTSLPPRRTQLSRTDSATSLHPPEKERRYFTDAQRDQIDAESKQVLQELNGAIRNLAEAEQLRQKTEASLTQRKHRKLGLGFVSRWAAGDSDTGKSPDEEMEEVRANAIKVHRDSIIWFLRRKLEQCGEVQRSMMEIRLVREVEKSKSVLYKTRGSSVVPAVGASTNGDVSGRASGLDPGAAKRRAGRSAHLEETERSQIEEQLSPEQLQLFAQENQDMLKHYEDTLDQVRTAERSLVEISELQTTLVDNLATQSAHIEQLVTDSMYTTENVGGGNKQLKRATERKSTAKYVFYGSCAFSLFLIVYDLII